MQLRVSSTAFTAIFLIVVSNSIFAQSSAEIPSVPINVSPVVSESLAFGSTVTFTWQAQAGVDAYDFHLFDRTDGELTFTRDVYPSNICSGTTCSLSQNIALPAITDHAWRVRAKRGANVGGWSRSLFNVVRASEQLATASSASAMTQGSGAQGSLSVVPVVPVNVTPSVGDNLAAGSTVTFTWQAQPGVSAYDFHLFDRTDGDLTFTRDIFPSDVCSQTLCTIQQFITLPAIANHAWRVRAKTISSISGWSRNLFNVVRSGSTSTPTITTPVASTESTIPTASTVTQTSALAVPVNISPAVGQSLAVGATTTFTWQAQSGVSTYDFHLFDRTNGDLTFTNNLSPSTVCSGSVCSIRQAIRLPVAQNHAWRVRARSASTVTGWSRNVFDVVGASNSVPAVPVAIVAPTVTPTASSSADFEPGSTFYWQLQGGVSTSRNADIFGVDLEDNEFNGLIDSLKAKGKHVVCYFSAGSYEQWRSDAGAFQPASLGNNLADWPGERYADIRTDNVRQIMRSRMDRAAQANCDAVEPDNTDAYQANNGLRISAQDQINYLRFLANYAHSVGLKIALKNTVDLINTANLATLFDFTMNESCYNYNECGTLSAFTRLNKAVYIAQYGSQNQSWCASANTSQFFLAFYNRNQLLNGSDYYACN